MPKMVCRKCETEFQCKKNGVYVAEMFCNDEKIYKLWHADLWECPKCEAEVVAGFGNEGIEHHQSNLEDMIKNIESNGGIVIYDYEKVEKIPIGGKVL